MRPSLNYNFSDFLTIIEKLREKPNNIVLNQLKSELNSFFRDSKCREVLFTENNDKLFFGMCVLPYIDGDITVKILQDDKPYRIEQYYLEIDSKLFDPLLDLTNGEILAILLHEVGHVVNDSSPVEEVRESIDKYLLDTDDNLVISDSIHYREILAFGIKDTIKKFCSMFEFDNEELLADEFVSAYGFGDELISAFNKITKHALAVNKGVSNKLIVLAWTLRLYKDVKVRRIPALKTLKKTKQLSPSKLEQREVENVIRRLNRIDDDILMSESSPIESLRNKYNETLRNIRLRGVKSFEDDFYEIQMRARNVTMEDDALYLIRSINNKMSIIDDYVSTEEGLAESDRQRWWNLYERYNKLRNTLSDKVVYRTGGPAIIIQYPNIVPGRM